MSASSTSQTALVESLMEYLETYQSGKANEQTYILAMNALRDLHTFIKKTEKVKDVAQKSCVVITIDGEEFYIEDYLDTRIAVRFTDNYAYSSDTGNFIGVWNENTRVLNPLI